MTAKKTPKGGRKGGTTYPRIPLKKAVEYATKLVSKTHTGAQPRDIIGPGVFGTAGSAANERFSALRQFSLLKGNDKGYEATDFARELCGTPVEGRQELIQRACLKPTLFKKLHDTFIHDTVSKAKVRQQALLFKVHPDVGESCAGIFLESAVYAGLCTVNGDSVSFQEVKVTEPVPDEEDSENSEEILGIDEASDDSDDDTLSGGQTKTDPQGSNSGGRANLEIKIDPSMDPEKLEKLLSVLRKFGQI